MFHGSLYIKVHLGLVQKERKSVMHTQKGAITFFSRNGKMINIYLVKNEKTFSIK